MFSVFRLSKLNIFIEPRDHIRTRLWLFHLQVRGHIARPCTRRVSRPHPNIPNQWIWLSRWNNVWRLVVLSGSNPALLWSLVWERIPANPFNCKYSDSLFGYYAFSKLTGSKIYGLFGTSLYTLANYRLSDITLRADIGEAFGMAFLPIALLGYFLVLHDNKNINGEAVKSVIPNWLLLGLSVSGIIISNVPLTVLCVFFLFLSYIVCLLLFPNVRSLTVLLDLKKRLWPAFY